MNQINQSQLGLFPKRSVSFFLIIGIVLAPIIFSWMLLRKGYSKKARIIGFGYLGLMTFLMAIEAGDMDYPETSMIAETQRKLPNDEQPAPSLKKDIQKITEKPVFNLTVDEFLNRYNRAISNLDRQCHFFVAKEQDNGTFLTVTISGDDKAAMVINADRDSRAVQSFTFLGSGDGTLKSGVDVLKGVCACVMAIENPEMPKNQRSEIMDSLGIGTGKVKDEELKFVRNGVSYFFTVNDIMGTMFIGEPLKNT